MATSLICFDEKKKKTTNHGVVQPSLLFKPLLEKVKKENLQKKLLAQKKFFILAHLCSSHIVKHRPRIYVELKEQH